MRIQKMRFSMLLNCTLLGVATAAPQPANSTVDLNSVTDTKCTAKNV